MHDQQGIALLEIEKFDEERRTFSGIASTPTLDRDGDIIEPLGVTVDGAVPLLLHHDKQRPVGTATLGPPTAKGIPFEASIPKVTEPGVLKDQTDLAWHSVKYGVLRAVSVRVAAKREDVKKLAGGGLHWLKSAIRELSLVTIGANPDALIQAVRSLDSGRTAATGDPDVENPPRDRGPSAAKAARRATSMKTYADQIKEAEATLASKVTEREAIQTKASDEGRPKDDAERETFKSLTDDIANINAEIADLKMLAEGNKTAAVEVNGEDAKKAADARAGKTIVKFGRTLEEREPGTRFAQFAMCVAASKGNYMAAEQLARSRYPDDAQMHEVLKAAVAAGTTQDANWAGNLVQYQNLAQPFIGLLEAQTILGKFGQNGVPALNKVPFKVRVFTETGGGDAYWVQEARPKPLTALAFGTATLDFHKLATIAVLTQEEVRFSNPSAEVRVRNRLVKAIAKRADIDFVDPANLGTANTKPASITAGIAAIPATGATAAHFATDFGTLYGSFVTNHYDPSSLVVLMSASQAMQIAMMRTTLNAKEYPEMTIRGGFIEGIPVVVSQHLAGVGSPSTGMIVMLSAEDILLADDGQVTIDSSDQASVEMLDGSLLQNASNGTGASLVSLWQNNLLGLRAERFMTWKLARATAVAYISPAAYAA